jgi:hypothetical protein
MRKAESRREIRVLIVISLHFMIRLRRIYHENTKF